jgi:hypothetical protein
MFSSLFTLTNFIIQLFHNKKTTLEIGSFSVRLPLDVVVRSALWTLERTGHNFKPIPEPGTVLKLDLSLSNKLLSEISVLSIHKAATPD